MLRFLDIGWTFGMSAGRTFDPWDVEMIHPRGDDEINGLMDSCDLVIFGGGADIHPSLYGHPNVATGAGKEQSARDRSELAAFKLASDLQKPMFGICRGAQFLCAMAGGTLIQDVSGHGGMHALDTIDGREIIMTSAHHQMMYPAGTTHELIAWTRRRSRHYKWAGSDLFPKDYKEPEIVYFPKINSLAVQGHPEFFGSPFADGVVYTRELVNKYLLKGEMKDV